MRLNVAPQSGTLHVFDVSPAELPPVTRRELETAWLGAAQLQEAASPARRFRFASAADAPVELVLEDRDAAMWAAVVERMAGLGTSRGVSLCLRLVGLVALLAQAEWARPWFTIRRNGAEIHQALLQAAALAPLNQTGGFDETALRALLPPLQQMKQADG